jgi:hypothetical protein
MVDRKRAWPQFLPLVHSPYDDIQLPEQSEQHDYLHGWDHRHSLQVPRLWLELIRAHDQIFSQANKALLKRPAITVSIAGFAVHLVLVFLSPEGSSPGAASNLPRR